MKPKQNDYQQLKRFLFAVKDFTPAIDGRGVNELIWNASAAALDKLEEGDRLHVKAASGELQRKAKRLGEKGSLELLAAIGNVIAVTGQNTEVSDE